MQFDSSFSVRAPVSEVFAVIADTQRVVACVPGATVLERRADNVYEVALKAQVGPLWRRYLATITVLERDGDTYRIVMTNSARDAKGRHVGDATIEIGLTQLGPYTNVSIYSRATIVDGMIAEKTITEASARQVAQFAASLQAMVAAPPRP